MIMLVFTNDISLHSEFYATHADSAPNVLSTLAVGVEYGQPRSLPSLP